MLLVCSGSCTLYSYVSSCNFKYIYVDLYPWTFYDCFISSILYVFCFIRVSMYIYIILFYFQYVLVPVEMVITVYISNRSSQRNKISNAISPFFFFLFSWLPRIIMIILFLYYPFGYSFHLSCEIIHSLRVSTVDIRCSTVLVIYHWKNKIWRFFQIYYFLLENYAWVRKQSWCCIWYCCHCTCLQLVTLKL